MKKLKKKQSQLMECVSKSYAHKWIMSMPIVCTLFNSNRVIVYFVFIVARFDLFERFFSLDQ